MVSLLSRVMTNMTVAASNALRRCGRNQMAATTAGYRKAWQPGGAAGLLDRQLRHATIRYRAGMNRSQGRSTTDGSA